MVVACEEQLPVQEARTGDSEAWNILLKRYQLPLYAYVFELVRDEQRSLDIVQETFCNAVRFIDRLQADARFGSWLFSIAHQKCVAAWRKKHWLFKEFEDGQLEEIADPGDDPGARLLRHEEGEALMACIDRLELGARAVILLHFFEDFSLEEIAGIVGAPLGTVKSRLHYAKRALKKLMELKDHEDTA